MAVWESKTHRWIYVLDLCRGLWTRTTCSRDPSGHLRNQNGVAVYWSDVWEKHLAGRSTLYTKPIWGSSVGRSYSQLKSDSILSLHSLGYPACSHYHIWVAVGNPLHANHALQKSLQAMPAHDCGIHPTPPRPSNYPVLDSKYHQIRTIKFQRRVVGRSRHRSVCI